MHTQQTNAPLSPLLLLPLLPLLPAATAGYSGLRRAYSTLLPRRLSKQVREVYV
jgi:hypothetical protein